MSKTRKALFAASLILAAGVVPAMEAEQLPDPTRPPLLHQAALRRLSDDKIQHYTVTAIKISDDSRKAIVNGQLLNEGARIGEAVIVEINLDAVVIEYLSERHRYKLLPYTVRRAAKNRSVEE